jgi:microsomal dipeptidase-like Zn-dependent dipeptidase
LKRLLLLSMLLLLVQEAFGDSGAVELHAHLFMKEGMTWAFRGDFFGPLQATSWKDTLSSQANPETLENSGLTIVVAALYAHPLFSLNLRDSIRRQVLLARKFVLTHPDWVLAGDPEQAKEAIRNNKRVMILGLEGASGIIENEADLKEFVDEDGIRIIAPLHLMDDEFGGTAFLKSFRVLSSPWAWLKQLFSPIYIEGVRTNHDGLTDQGRWLTHALLAHHVWIDLSHASDVSAKELIPIILQAGQPLLYTHTVLRRFHEAERGIADWELSAVQASHGIVGLMPSEEMLEGAPRTADCTSGVSALAMEYTEISSKLGSDAVMLGSDYNGGIPHLAPGCHSGTSIDQSGVWNIGQSTEIWQAMAKLGADIPVPLKKVADHFIETWAKAFGKESSS